MCGWLPSGEVSWISMPQSRGGKGAKGEEGHQWERELSAAAAKSSPQLS